MNVDQVTDYLQNTAREIRRAEVQIHQGVDIASVRLWRNESPETWVDIASPGAMWARVSVDGGFMLIEADDTMDDAELIAKIEEFFAVAAAYLENRPRPRGRFFPIITVETHIGPRALKRSLFSDVRHLVSRRAGRKQWPL